MSEQHAATPGDGESQARRHSHDDRTDGARCAETPVLQVRDMTVRYGGVTAVDHVSIRVRRGTVLGVVGESGAGKSTLARAIAGLIHPAGGSVTLNGQLLAADARGRSLDQHRRLQMVFQNPQSSLNPRLTIRQILSEGMRLHRLDGSGRCSAGFTRNGRRARQWREDRCAELLDLVGLADAGGAGEVLDRRPGAFSGGQQQRIAVARALAVNPDVLVADEPTSALDVSVQRELLDLLDGLRRERGLSMLLITHDLAVVNALCDDVVVMRGGRVVAGEPVERFFRDPGEGYAAELLAAAQAVSL